MQVRVLEGQTLEMFNVLSYRAKMTRQEMEERLKDFQKVLNDNKAHRVGSTVTATFAIENGLQESVMDIEVLQPIDKTIVPPKGFTWKPHFLLKNALVVRHIGNPSELQKSADIINTYIVNKHLIPITVGYNVTVKEAKTIKELNDTIVDIYVGISPNIL